MSCSLCSNASNTSTYSAAVSLAPAAENGGSGPIDVNDVDDVNENNEELIIKSAPYSFINRPTLESSENMRNFMERVSFDTSTQQYYDYIYFFIESFCAFLFGTDGLAHYFLLSLCILLIILCALMFMPIVDKYKFTQTMANLRKKMGCNSYLWLLGMFFLNGIVLYCSRTFGSIMFFLIAIYLGGICFLYGKKFDFILIIIASISFLLGILYFGLFDGILIDANTNWFTFIGMIVACAPMISIIMCSLFRIIVKPFKIVETQRETLGLIASNTLKSTNIPK